MNARSSLRGLIALGLTLGLHATPAWALPVSNLHTYASGLVHNYPQWPASSVFEVDDAAAGSVTADARAGNVMNVYNPDLRVWVEGMLDAEAHSRASYGSNGAFIESNVANATGDERGAFPNIDLVGGTVRVEMYAESVWTDTFVITGGDGVGTANVSVDVHGLGETRYGANGDAWYPGGLEAYGTGGFGSAQYGLDIQYDTLPPGVDEEYNQPIRWSQDYPAPLPTYQIISLPLPPGTLTGSFVFVYGVPFALSSSLSLIGNNQISLDYDNTATLSGFELPEGASLTSGSGHVYPVAGAPEPSVAWLIGSGLLCSLWAARRKR